MPELLEAPATETDPFADIQADPFADIPNEDDPFADIVSESPTSESEKALAETPKPQSTLVQLEKGVENLSGMPIHQVMNSVRVFGSAAGKYIFSGLQGLEIETAKALKNPPSELTTPQAEAVLLPQEEQDALEQKYIAETQAAVPDALVRAEYWKQRAEGADEQSEVDPALAKTIPARLSAVAGEATMMGMEALVPGVGLPLMVMHGALATEAEALNHGQTPEQAEAAAVRSAIGLAIFGGASKVAALGVAKLLPKAITDPNKLTKFMAQFVGQEAANESSSRVIAAWNAASDAPPGEKVEHALQALKETTLEQSALNTAFALIGASKAAGARPLGTRPVNTTDVVTTKPPVGVTQLEARNPAIAARLAEERAVRPASEPEAAPVMESGMPAETQRYAPTAEPPLTPEQTTVSGQAAVPKTRMDLILDGVEKYGEVTIAIEGPKPTRENIGKVQAAAEARGMNAAFDGQNYLIRKNSQPDPMLDPAKNPQGTVAAIEEIQRRNAPEPISPLPAEASTANAAAPAEPKRSKIGQSIEAKAVEAKLTEGFSETAGYDPITIADQAQRATGLVKSSINDARAVIRGEAPLPEGLRGTSLITAMEEHLSRKPDAQVAYELANSPLTSATSAAAQEMRLMSERVPDGITAKFQEIREARKAGSKQRGETSERVVQDIQREMVRNASKRPTWESFVKSITC